MTKMDNIYGTSSILNLKSENFGCGSGRFPDTEVTIFSCTTCFFAVCFWKGLQKRDFAVVATIKNQARKKNKSRMRLG
jgi:hypothetical protein